MAVTKDRPTVGDRMFEVEWCSHLPRNEFGDCDIDAATMICRNFRSLAAAQRYARKVYPLDAFGSVAITEHEFVPYDPADARRYPHAGFWDAVGHSEHYEGPET